MTLTADVPRLREQIKSVTRWQTVVDYSNDGGRTWTQATLISGSISCDATSQIRWTCQLVLTDVEVSLDGINAITTRLRIRHGIAGERLLPMGIYRLKEPQQSLISAERVRVSGESFESYIIQAEFPTPRTLGRAAADTVLNQLIKEVLPRATIVWDPRLNRSQWMPQMIADHDRWAIIDGGATDPSVAKAVGGMAYCNASGQWIVAPPGSLDDPVSWEAADGETHIDATITQNVDEIANIIVVTGQTEDGTPFGPVILRDDDPDSITYWRRSPDAGGFGQKPFRYSSPGITRQSQASLVAATIRDQRMGARWPVQFTSLHDPTIRPGDVGLVTTPQNDRQRMIVDSITWTFSDGGLPEPMKANLRSKAAPTR